jgi:hypothetical protein
MPKRKRPDAAIPSAPGAMSRRHAPKGSRAFALQELQLSPPQLGERIAFYCTPCGHEADATYSKKYGRPEWLIGSPNRYRCPGGEVCLCKLADWLGAPSPAALKTDPRPFLAQVASSQASTRNDAGEALPSSALIDGWHARLLASNEPLAYLETRGLTVATTKRYRLGWDGDARTLTAPVYQDGELVNLLRRRLGPGEPFAVLRGRGSQFFPEPRPGGVVLLAGIFDALSARQAGLRSAVTTTCGARLPDHLVPALAGRPIAVAYDAGEEALAAITVEKLRAAGSQAWVVRLSDPKLGLPAGGDVNDHFRAGGTLRALVGLIRRERVRP